MTVLLLHFKAPVHGMHNDFIKLIQSQVMHRHIAKWSTCNDQKLSGPMFLYLLFVRMCVYTLGSVVYIRVCVHECMCVSDENAPYSIRVYSTCRSKRVETIWETTLAND